MDYNIPEPDYKDTLNYSDAVNEDIRKRIHKNFPIAVKQTRAFASQFRGANAKQTAHNIWNFIKTHCVYQKDEPEKQCIKLPSRFIHEGGYSDCKSFALTSAALLANNGLPVSFRYANYRGGDIPSHVYTVTRDENGKEIIVDAVWQFFNSEKRPTSKFDEPMKVYTLSGTSDTAETAVKFPHFKAWVIKRAAARGLNLVQIKKNNPQRFKTLMHEFQASFKKRNELRRLHKKQYSGTLPEMIRGIENDYNEAGIGSFFGKLFKGVAKIVTAPVKLGFKAVKAATGFAWTFGKKLALGPARTAFRGLVHINFKGLAQKLKRLNDKAPLEAKKKWESLGGSYSALLSSVRHGYNHWAKAHNKGPMTGIYGCDLPTMYRQATSLGIHSLDDEGIGFAPALIGLAATIIAAFAKLFNKHKVDDVAAITAGRESSTDDLVQAATDGVEAFNRALPSGAPPLSSDDPTDPNNASQFDLQKNKDDTPDDEAGFSLNLPTVLLLGGTALLFLSPKRKAA